MMMVMRKGNLMERNWDKLKEGWKETRTDNLRALSKGVTKELL
jgi:hypothetical protein